MRGAAAILALAGLAGCRKAALPPLAEPHQTLEGFTLSQSYKGVPAWDLTADKALLKEDAKDAALTQPHLNFYKNRTLSTQVSSLAGTVKLDSYDVRLESAVVVTSIEDNSTLRTERLDYSSQKNKFLTDRDVVVRRPDGVLRGKGLEATPDLSEIRIFNQRSELEGGAKL